MLTPKQRKSRAKLASKTARANRHPADPKAAAEVEEARREYRALSAEVTIRRLVDEAPPLTPEMRDALTILLRGDAA